MEARLILPQDPSTRWVREVKRQQMARQGIDLNLNFTYVLSRSEEGV
jgi:hypothetical protein